MKKLFSLLLISVFTIHANQDVFSLKFGSSRDECLIDLQSTELQEFSKDRQSEIQEGIYNFILEGPSGIHIPVKFYDRNSDTILIVGQGLPGTKESVKIFADIFNTYDVILFDYRWVGRYPLDLAKGILTNSAIQKIVLDEVEEVQTVLNFVKEHKKYRSVVGLGECYSNFLFAKVQADAVKQCGRGPFTHLILDSSWHSIRLLAEQICFDPFLPIRPQSGGAPLCLRKITHNKVIKNAILKAVFAVINDISIESYLAGLSIPVLFIYGLQDLFVPKEHFELMWQATNPDERVALFTPYRHSDNLHNKILYQYICEQFVAADSTKDVESTLINQNLI